MTTFLPSKLRMLLESLLPSIFVRAKDEEQGCRCLMYLRDPCEQCFLQDRPSYAIPIPQVDLVSRSGTHRICPVSEDASWHSALRSDLIFLTADLRLSSQ